MPIANRKLKPGTVLIVCYKGEEHRAEVVKTKEGLRYKLKDGQEFKSPSAAGVAVKGGGKTCDGWEFWSVEGAPAVPPRAQRTKTAEATPKSAKAKSKPKSKAEATTKAEPKVKAESPVTCGDCGQEFPSSREAAEHMRDEHGSAEAPGNGGR